MFKKRHQSVKITKRCYFGVLRKKLDKFNMRSGNLHYILLILSVSRRVSKVAWVPPRMHSGPVVSAVATRCRRLARTSGMGYRSQVPEKTGHLKGWYPAHIPDKATIEGLGITRNDLRCISAPSTSSSSTVLSLTCSDS